MRNFPALEGKQRRVVDQSGVVDYDIERADILNAARGPAIECWALIRRTATKRQCAVTRSCADWRRVVGAIQIQRPCPSCEKRLNEVGAETLPRTRLQELFGKAQSQRYAFRFQDVIDRLARKLLLEFRPGLSSIPNSAWIATISFKYFSESQLSSSRKLLTLATLHRNLRRRRIR